MMEKAPLTPEAREAWLQVRASGIQEQMLAKFRAGQVEHAGDIGELSVRSLLDQMEQEAMDQLWYVKELKRRLL